MTMTLKGAPFGPPAWDFVDETLVVASDRGRRTARASRGISLRPTESAESSDAIGVLLKDWPMGTTWEVKL